MLPSLMQNFNKRDMQAVINAYNYKAYYHPTLFPLKQNYTLTFKAIEQNLGLKVAADVIARNATIGEKTRGVVSAIYGDIPKLGIKRKLDESELERYNELLVNTPSDQLAKAIVEFWADDTKFCFDGMGAKVELIALKTLFEGKVSFTPDNNADVVTEFNLDYQCPNQFGVTTGWADAQNAKPLDDLRLRVRAAKAKGISPKFAFMSMNTFVLMAQTKQMIETCASFAANALNIAGIPTLEDVNSALARQSDLYGLQIVVIDQDDILVEKPNGESIQITPATDNSVVLTESKIVGQTYWKRPIEADIKNTPAVAAINGYTCIRKWSEEEPVAEITTACANVLPVLTTAKRNIMIDVAHDTWSI